MSGFFTFVTRSLFWLFVIAFSLGLYVGVEVNEIISYTALSGQDKVVAEKMYPNIERNYCYRLGVLIDE